MSAAKECKGMGIACHGDGPSDRKAAAIFMDADGHRIMVRMVDLAELLDSSLWWSVERHEPVNGR